MRSTLAINKLVRIVASMGVHRIRLIGNELRLRARMFNLVILPSLVDAELTHLTASLDKFVENSRRKRMQRFFIRFIRSEFELQTIASWNR